MTAKSPFTKRKSSLSFCSQPSLQALVRFDSQSIVPQQRIEAIVEAFIDMQDDLNEERRVTERRWSNRERQIQRVICKTELAESASRLHLRQWPAAHGANEGTTRRSTTHAGVPMWCASDTQRVRCELRRFREARRPVAKAANGGVLSQESSAKPRLLVR